MICIYFKSKLANEIGIKGLFLNLFYYIMVIEEKYKINLGYLSCFRNVSSLGAFRVIVVYDCLLWAFNSILLVETLYFYYETEFFRMIIIGFCTLNVLWAMFVDLRKSHYIERGGFMKSIGFFTTLTRVYFLFIMTYYLLILIAYLVGFGFSMFSNNLEELGDKYMSVDKFSNRPISLNIFSFLIIILIFLLHLTMFKAVRKLPNICKMVKIEQEDVIITAMDRDYLEEGFIYQERSESLTNDRKEFYETGNEEEDHDHNIVL